MSTDKSHNILPNSEKHQDGVDWVVKWRSLQSKD